MVSLHQGTGHVTFESIKKFILTFRKAITIQLTSHMLQQFSFFSFLFLKEVW